jgi:multiple sugar transport system ATP-binding protein
MSKLVLRGIGKTYLGDVNVIKDLDLEVHDGEFMVFVGPSGCGKTTLLRMIAGLEDITAGTLHFDDECVNDEAPAERGAAMVFQSYALYPHMTVAENLAFSLKMAGVSKAEQQKQVGQVADILQIRPLLDRKPKALSGGQRQRVAIGRAIVRKPKVFLFDEPLSNLDANLRVQMRVELTKLHQELGCTMVYVTHDQVEAMTLGQRIAVFNKGKIEQIGTPLEVYHHPANTFVAEFMGSPKMNLLPAHPVDIADGRKALQVAAAGTVDLPQGLAPNALVATLGVRPEHFTVSPTTSGLEGHIALVEHLGEATLVHVRLLGTDNDVAMKLPGSHPQHRAGQSIRITCSDAHMSLFDDTGKAIAITR